MAPVIKQLNLYPEKINVWNCVTGQHRDMLDQVLNLFNISPDIDCKLMQVNQTPNQVAARVLSAMDSILDDVCPDIVLVQGDTTTVMATSIAAHYHRIKVGHVEAGLRTYDRSHPFPEEMNRVITDHVSDLHFAPTLSALNNLLREGISRKNAFVTGNTVIDALNWINEQPMPPNVNSLLAKMGISDDGQPASKWLILVTAHRRESFGQPISNICLALQALADRRDVHIVYPVHCNPNVWDPVHKLLGKHPHITLIPPVDYLAL